MLLEKVLVIFQKKSFIACLALIMPKVTIWTNQRAKEDLSEILAGFQRKEGDKQGCEVIQVRAWDYPMLLEAYARAEQLAREESIPVILHIIEVTQPQGHSTSGSHERYKNEERIAALDDLAENFEAEQGIHVFF